MPGLFAMHSLVVYRLWANTYRHKEERLDVSNYGNKPLQDYIFSFVNDGSVEKVGVAPGPKRVGPASCNLEYG